MEEIAESQQRLMTPYAARMEENGEGGGEAAEWRAGAAAAALAGAAAGLVATGPMTMAMERLHRRLPPEQRYALPPRLITERMVDLGSLPPQARADVSLLAHYGYGAAVGALYPLAARALGERSPALTGAAYGMLVWTASYLGWIPAAGVLTSAVHHPARRNALMIAVHLVWGATTGTVCRRLQYRPPGFMAPVPPDLPEIPGDGRRGAGLAWGAAAALALGGALVVAGARPNRHRR